MSFFAGDGKLHITKNTRSIEELNSSTIYHDTTFHSDMNVICSQGEYVVQSYKANFNVRHGDFPLDIIIPEQCYEVALPTQVINALVEQQVVLVQINTGSGEAALNFPINIKTGLRGTTSSVDTDYSVAVAPQITVGGRYDVCFSYSSIKDANISPNLANVGNSGRYKISTDSHIPTKKVMPWTTNPDFPGITPSTLRAGARYAQIHFYGERWKLENTTVGSTATLRNDNPSFLPLTQNAPTFTFIILNVKFIAGKFTTINPFNLSNKEILLKSGKVLINGKDLTSIKLVQTSNKDAIGAFDPSKSLNRLLPALQYRNMQLTRTGLWFYKKYDSFIFTQGARYPNGVPLLRPATGGTLMSYEYHLNDNWASPTNDVLYEAPPMDSTFITGSTTFSECPKLMGTPVNGTSGDTYPNIYFTNSNKLLLGPGGSYSNGIPVLNTPYALLDTSKFTGLYIDNQGIKGTYNGKEIPVYNNNSAATYLIEVTNNNYSPKFTIIDDGTLEFTQELMDIQAIRGIECLLVGVNVLGGRIFASDIDYPIIYLPSGHKRIVSDDYACDLGYDNTAATYGLVKIASDNEIVLAHGYLDATLKYYGTETVSPERGSPYLGYDISTTLYVAYITISLKRVSNKLYVITRAVTEKGKFLNTNIGGPGYDDFTFKWVDAPQITVAVTKIQS